MSPVPSPAVLRRQRLCDRFGPLLEGNEGAFRLDDNWVVFNSTSGVPVESRYSELNAMRAVEACNDHERRNGRPEVYAYKHLG